MTTKKHWALNVQILIRWGFFRVFSRLLSNKRTHFFIFPWLLIKGMNHTQSLTFSSRFSTKSEFLRTSKTSTHTTTLVRFGDEFRLELVRN